MSEMEQAPAPGDAGEEFVDDATARAERHARRRRFVGQLVEGDSYGTLLVLLVALFIAMPAIDESPAGRFVLTVLLIAVLLLALHISRARRSTMIVAASVSALLVLFRVIHDLLGHDTASGLSIVAAGAILLMAPAAVGRRVMEHRVVARETVLGAICVYLMLGLMFTYVYQAVEFWSGQAFFAQKDTVSGGDLFYFSYVTLTTLGYGDLSPATQWGRSLAVLEALIGQLYLATTIARLVGAVGMRRAGPTRIHDHEGAVAPPTDPPQPPAGAGSGAPT